MTPTQKTKGLMTVPILYIAVEVSTKDWVVFSSVAGGRRRHKVVPAGNLEALVAELQAARKKAGLPETAEIVSCYEAGFSGFWLHRRLEDLGVESYVFKASILGAKVKRRRKTDRLDGDDLLRILICWHHFNEERLHPVRVPCEQIEDERGLHRERSGLKKERNIHRNRIRTLLALHGLKPNWKLEDPIQFLEIKPCLRAELERELERLALVEEHVHEVEKARLEVLRTSNSRCAKLARVLLQLVSVGVNGAWVISYEFLGWREFKNRRQVGALAGLVGVPHNSGEMVRDRGISKEGNSQVRSLMVELAWLWLRNQKESRHTKWFNERFGKGKRARKIGIVALARRLLISFWRLAEQGIVPEGARLKAV